MKIKYSIRKQNYLEKFTKSLIQIECESTQERLEVLNYIFEKTGFIMASGKNPYPKEESSNLFLCFYEDWKDEDKAVIGFCDPVTSNFKIYSKLPIVTGKKFLGEKEE